MGRLNPKSVKTRTLSAFILIPFVLFAVIWGGIPFYLMIAVLGFLAVHEWVTMARRVDGEAKLIAIGFVYIFVGFFACVLIREYISFYAAILFLLMVWASDIGAYFSGKIIGGPKMAPLISPNKTWAGFGGACFFPALAGLLYILGHILNSAEGLFSFSQIFAVFVTGLLLGAVCQAGDLAVSMMKRRAEVKDTGALIPGHGGILDRIDAMLLAAPMFFVLVRMFGLNL